MDYKNFYLRSFFSFIFLFLYIISLLDTNYLFLLGLVVYFIIFYEVLSNFKKSTLLIFSYLIISLTCFSLYVFKYFNFYDFNLLILTIIFFDTLSYIFGTFLGKNFPFKKISPNKSFEGYFLGLISTNLFCYLFINFFFSNLNYVNYLIFINLIIFFSLIGDLLQSYFKRLNDLKDSSKLLPGHGGFFDRFDSFIIVIIYLLIYGYIY